MTVAPAELAEASVWIVDLDGVLWLAGQPIGDVASAVRSLRSRGIRVVFATNNSAPTTEVLLTRLRGAGIEADAADLATSAAAVASLLDPGQRARVLAEDGVFEALHLRFRLTDLHRPSGARGRSAARYQRGPDPPHPGRTGTRLGRTARRRGHRLGSHTGDCGKAASADGGVDESPVRIRGWGRLGGRGR
jgi:hypothetical protein